MNDFRTQDKSRRWLHIRIGFIGVVLSIAFVAVIGRVYYLQTAKAEYLLEKASVKVNREVTMHARRGNILDRNGVELAVTVEAPSIAARPRLIENPEREARRLLPHLSLQYETLVKRLSSSSNFVWLERQARPASAEAIKNLDIPGIAITTEYKRYYPLRERAAQLLGFVGIDGIGLEGIERQLQDELAGDTYQMSITRDARGRAMLTHDTPQFHEFEGHSVQLSIDEKIQHVAERALQKRVEEVDAKSGYAIAMDVHTGAILAMANTPTFDPNRFGDYTSEHWRLKNITDTFEPGSIFKPFGFAAALEEGTISLTSTFDCENGRYRIGKHTIHDVSRRKVITAGEIIQVSSNICSYKIAQTIGRDAYYEYMRAFGFGRRTGLGLRGEQPGLIWPPNRWAEIAFANVAFGQGLTTTPLQMVTAISAIANGGLLLEPYIIESVFDRNGTLITQASPTLIRRVISPKSARDTAWAMSLVTSKGGTGTQAAIDGFTVAGKTGTAQKVNPETRRYDPDLWMSGFVGFVPAERPEIAIVVMIDEPKKARYGGVVTGPVFKEIAVEALAIRGVLPVPEHERFDLGIEDKKKAAEQHASRPMMQVWQELSAPHEDDNTIAAGTVSHDEVEQSANDDYANVVFMPDFRQMSLRKATETALQLGRIPRIEGWGQVIAQEPVMGAPLADGMEIKLVLSPVTGKALIATEPSLGTGQ